MYSPDKASETEEMQNLKSKNSSGNKFTESP